MIRVWLSLNYALAFIILCLGILILVDESPPVLWWLPWVLIAWGITQAIITCGNVVVMWVTLLFNIMAAGMWVFLIARDLQHSSITKSIVFFLWSLIHIGIGVAPWYYRKIAR